MRCFGVLLALGLVACGAPEQRATIPPTLGPILETSQGFTQIPTVEASSLPAVTAITATPTSTAAIITADSDDYRALMEEARVKHPYPETVDVMWDVMMCESSGNPTIAGPGGLMGLFQYTPETWNGSWNPYRDQPITDARAQIFATAKAWMDGYQQWWQICLP